MTREQAHAEAWRRWGTMGPPRTYVWATRRRTQGHRFEVSAAVEGHDDRGRLVPFTRIAFGASNESWEDAFADADRRALAAKGGA